MTLAADRPLRPLARPSLGDATLEAALVVGLVVAGCAHLVLALEHLTAVFAIFAAAAGAAQIALAVKALRGPAQRAAGPAMILSLALIQLYVLNVTVGLPPLIAHTHVPGTHEVLGVTLAWPNTIDPQGVLAQLAQAYAVVAAAVLQLAPPHRTP